MNTKDHKYWKNDLTDEQNKFTQTALMVKLLGTVDERGWPHITFIMNNHACANDEIVWGEFMHGKSKQYIQDHPKHGYLFMSVSLPFTMFQIKADFSHINTSGDEIEQFNKSADMRYSTTMNVWRVFYNKVKATSRLQKISLIKVLGAGITNSFLKLFTKKNSKTIRLDKFGQNIFGSIMNPKFLIYIDPKDQYPIILPCFQAFPLGGTQMAFRNNQFATQLNQIPKGSKIAIYGLTMDFIAQETRGTFLGFSKSKGITLGRMEIEEVYNSGPPLPGRIYPEIEFLREVTVFE